MVSLKSIMSEHHGIEITESQESLMIEDLHLVMEINKTMNLTRITDEEEAIVRHLEDSILGFPYLEGAPEGLYADLGTGGGFPGIPLCILSKRQTILVDSVKKKVRSLESVSEKLGISDRLSTYGGRIEDLAIDKPEAFSVLTARALSSLGSLLELSSPLLKRGGRLICYKAQPSQDEIDTASGITKPLGFALLKDETHLLSDGSTRRIFVFEKTNRSAIPLPRRIGLAQREPLGAKDFPPKKKRGGRR